jgi:hypothetical protein
MGCSLSQNLVGRGLAEISREIAADAFHWIGPKEGRQAQAALHQSNRIETIQYIWIGLIVYQTYRHFESPLQARNAVTASKDANRGSFWRKRCVISRAGCAPNRK